MSSRHSDVESQSGESEGGRSNPSDAPSYQSIYYNVRRQNPPSARPVGFTSHADDGSSSVGYHDADSIGNMADSTAYKSDYNHSDGVIPKSRKELLLEKHTARGQVYDLLDAEAPTSTTSHRQTDCHPTVSTSSLRIRLL